MNTQEKLAKIRVEWRMNMPKFICERYRRGTNGEYYKWTHIVVMWNKDGSWHYQREFIETL